MVCVSTYGSKDIGVVVGSLGSENDISCSFSLLSFVSAAEGKAEEKNKWATGSYFSCFIVAFVKIYYPCLATFFFRPYSSVFPILIYDEVLSTTNLEHAIVGNTKPKKFWLNLQRTLFSCVQCSDWSA
jgi:hypothetical protein